MAETNSPNIYLCTEQDNDVKESRLSVLLFRDQQAMTQTTESSSSSSSLTALQEWDLTADLKSVGHNEGLEAITWVPDWYLVQHGLLDDSLAATDIGVRGEASSFLYDPERYPGHGSGLFFVGLEGNLACSCLTSPPWLTISHWLKQSQPDSWEIVCFIFLSIHWLLQIMEKCTLTL